MVIHQLVIMLKLLIVIFILYNTIISSNYLSVDTEFQQQVVYKQAKPLGIHKHSNSSKSPLHQCKTTFNEPSKGRLATEHTVEDVKIKEDNLVKLKDVFREELLVFMANKDVIKVDYPSTLSSLDRKALHEVCEFNYNF